MKFLFFCMLLFCGQLYAQSFEPGLWKTKESFKVGPIEFPENENEDCITGTQAKDAKATIEKELKKKGCALEEWKVKKLQLNAVINCQNDDIEAVGKLQGKFTKKSYDLNGDIKGKYKKSLPAKAKLKLSGRWVKKCPQEEISK